MKKKVGEKVFADARRAFCKLPSTLDDAIIVGALLPSPVRCSFVQFYRARTYTRTLTHNTQTQTPPSGGSV